jgi:catalase-peroxidase
MSTAPTGGAPRIHGELLMLGIEIAESTLAKYMVPRSRRPPSQSGKTFLCNHAAGIASIDLFVVQTAFFKLLYGLVIVRHGRQRLVDFGITSRPTAEWIAGQVKWSNNFFENLFGYEWELTKSPAGAYQWKAKGDAATIPDAFAPSKRHAPTMLVTDLALRIDPVYEKISRRFHEHPDEFADAFARAWFKLTHRDMGPRPRYLGPEVPAEELIWQDPVPGIDHKLIDAKDIADLKAKTLASRLSISELVGAAWASAATFRGSDKRGGANGARIRLAPQKDWEVNRPAQLAKVLETLAGIQKAFNGAARGGKKADLIVLGGSAAVEQAAKKAGYDVTVPFAPGRTDASQEQTDVESFA